MLRRISRERASAAAAAAAADPEATRRQHSTISRSRCPIRDGWSIAGCDDYGFEAAEAWARFDNSPAPLTLRVNRLRTTRDALTAALRSRRAYSVEAGRVRAGRAHRDARATRC